MKTFKKAKIILIAALLFFVSVSKTIAETVVVGVFNGVQYSYQTNQVDYSSNATDRLVAVWVRNPTNITGFETEAVQIKINCPQRRWTYIGAALLFTDQKTKIEMSKLKVIENIGSVPIVFSDDNIVQTLFWQLCGREI